LQIKFKKRLFSWDKDQQKKMLIFDFVNQHHEYAMRLERDPDSDEANWCEFERMHLTFQQRYSAILEEKSI
jgi:hypothetical protein